MSADGYVNVPRSAVHFNDPELMGLVLEDLDAWDKEAE